MENRTQQIAKTILDQINFGDKWFLPAVGAKNFYSMSESKEFAGGLGFQCNGLNTSVHWVKIQLRWLDDYSIIFFNKNRETVKIVNGVYCDQLIEILDFVENQ
jgi:hypothetical protein